MQDVSTYENQSVQYTRLIEQRENKKQKPKKNHDHPNAVRAFDKIKSGKNMHNKLEIEGNYPNILKSIH